VYGRTYNPFDFGRTSGGSSGGCGAGLAACFAPIAVGSDVGGSIRIPAHYNGLFGHKPTGGTVSNDRCFPTLGNCGINTYCQLGPMSKHADDLWPLLLLLSKQQSADNGDDRLKSLNNSVSLRSFRLSAVSDVEIKSVEIFFSDCSLAHPWLVSKTHPEVVLRLKQSVAHLASLGCVTSPFPVASLVPEIFSMLNSFMMWTLLMHEGKDDCFKEVIRDQTSGFAGALHVLWETFLSIFELSDHTFPAMLMAVIGDAFAITPLSHNDHIRGLAKTVRSKLEHFRSGNRVFAEFADCTMSLFCEYLIFPIRFSCGIDDRSRPSDRWERA
jgi:fatty acid amide hydrolase 2